MKTLTNKKVRKALLGSIKKWELLSTDSNAFSKGSYDCNLCGLFNLTRKNPCHGCPVSEYTGKPFCFDSPFENHNNRQPWNIRRKAAQAELDFLKMLDKHYFGG